MWGSLRLAPTNRISTYFYCYFLDAVYMHSSDWPVWFNTRVIWRQTALCAELLLPDCVRFSCCSPIMSASAAARRMRPFQLLPCSVCFGCYSLIAFASCSGRFQPMPINVLEHSSLSSRFSELKYAGCTSLV